MLEIRNVYKSYGKNDVLKGISFTLDKGIYGLLGKNGAGKSTLIGIITGNLPMDHGDIFYNGNSLEKNWDMLRMDLGYMPQYASYYPTFSAEEFLRYMCVLKGVPKATVKNVVDDLLKKVNLYERRKQKIGTFSGGMRQRIGIAQAIINSPKILILDEPTAGLDPEERIRFQELMKELSNQMAILLVTHIVNDVANISDYVLFMNEGKIVLEEKTQKLLQQHSDLERLFLDSIHAEGKNV